MQEKTSKLNNLPKTEASGQSFIIGAVVSSTQGEFPLFMASMGSARFEAREHWTEATSPSEKVIQFPTLCEYRSRMDEIIKYNYRPRPEVKAIFRDHTTNPNTYWVVVEPKDIGKIRELFEIRESIKEIEASSQFDVDVVILSKNGYLAHVPNGSTKIL
jgi:transposase-like protein